MDIIFDDDDQDDYEPEIIDGILTFDELLEDEAYKAEFEKRVQERLDIQNSHSDVKGGTNRMDEQVQTSDEGEIDMVEAQTESQSDAQQPETTEHPAVEKTDAQKQSEDKAEEPTREMNARQFELYNETLRRISKTAGASLQNRYNAFEDGEVKTLVKHRILQGETPSIKDIAASVVTRFSEQEPLRTEEQAKQEVENEVLSLKTENALLKAGITAERIDAAKKLFIAEGAHFDKVAEFVAQYPEWQTQEGRVVYGKAQPLVGRTAPTLDSRPMLNDFEKAVAAARKQRGLD